MAEEVIFRDDVTVELIKSSASDADVIWAARVSTAGEQSMDEIGEDPARSAGLINYLARERHGSPFEHTSMTFFISAPIFVFREFMRHRIASYNEESGRYRELKPVFYIPSKDRKLVQVGKTGAYTFEEGTQEQFDITVKAMKDAYIIAYESYQKMLEAGVARVVVAMQDPNPKVAGDGLKILAAAGIAVEHGLMEAQARELNIGFVTRMMQNKPYVRVKIAASLDGRTALANRESKWITGEPARHDVQQWRARSCAILTGIGTVLADNPHMNVRIPTTRQPLKIIVDSQLRTPIDANILKDGNVLIAYIQADDARKSALLAAGAELIQIGNRPQVCLKTLLSELAKRGINELMVEAGQTLNCALLAAGLVDEFIFYYAPLILGADAHGMLAIPTLQSMQERISLKIVDTRQIGQDIRVLAKPVYPQ